MYVNHFRNEDIMNKEVKSFGWGVTYDEVKDGNTIVSSCMTNEESPEGYSFRPCDMSLVRRNLYFKISCV